MLSVLIVDDEPFIREGLKLLIDWNKEGFEIKGEAKNAYDAIELVKKNEYDLMFIDIKMPKMNGIELSQYLREKLQVKAEIVFLTGFLEIEYVNAAFQMKAFQYLQKPILPEQLLEVLRNLRKGVEERKLEEKSKRRSRMDMREYYLLELSHGVKNPENIQYLRNYFRNENTIYYVKISFYGNDLKETREFDEQFQKTKDRCKQLFRDLSYYVITQMGGLHENALGIIITGSILKKRRESIYELVDQLLKELSGVTVLNAIARIGKSVNDISKLNESYKNCLNSTPYLLNSKEIPLEVRLNTFLQAHYMENITLKSLSEQFYVNTAYLGQFFKKHNGVLLKEYLNGIRVQKATELLETSALKIYQIANEVGFRSVDSFIAAFSKEMGVTPQKYRNLKQNKPMDTQ